MEGLIDIYFALGRGALKENSYAECEFYSNKILELNSECVDAYVLKINLLTAKQRYGYCRETTGITRQEWVNNLQRIKNMYYYMLMSSSDFSKSDINDVIGFVANDYFCEKSFLSDPQFLVESYTGVQLLLKIYENFHMSDDEIIDSLMNLYDNYGNGDLDKCDTYLSAFTHKRKYMLRSEKIRNRYYDVLIKVKMRSLKN